MADQNNVITGGVVVYGVNRAFVDVQQYQRNNLTTIDVFRNRTAYTRYYDTGKVNNANVLTRAQTKELLRKYLYEYKHLFTNSTIVISYMCDDGIHYVDVENSKEMNEDIIENVLMLDPVSNALYEQIGSSSIKGRTIFGMKLMVLKHPEIVPKIKKIRKKFAFSGAPKLVVR